VESPFKWPTPPVYVLPPSFGTGRSFPVSVIDPFFLKNRHTWRDRQSYFMTFASLSFSEYGFFDKAAFNTASMDDAVPACAPLASAPY